MNTGQSIDALAHQFAIFNAFFGVYVVFGLLRYAVDVVSKANHKNKHHE